MTSCASCGASVPVGAAWCSQCYAPVSSAGPGVGTTAFAPAGSAAAGPPPAPPAVLGSPQPPPGMVVNRFGTIVPEAEVVPAVRPAPSMLPAQGDDAHGGFRRTGPLVGVAIGLGAVLQVVMLLLGRGGHTEPATLIRYSLVGTLGLYLAVSVLLVLHLGHTGTRLRWTDGSPALGVITGVLTGGTLALVMLAVIKLATGKASGDPRIELLVSEGSADHVLTAVAIAVVAAPLVEEVLFRGVLAESLRSRGSAAAIWISAAAFSAWHLNPAALRYYAVIGALLGGLYWKRGLVASMATHATFNGLLTLAAVLAATGPGQVVEASGLTLHAPSGWTTTKLPQPGTDVTLKGPSGSFLAIVARDVGHPIDDATIVARLQSLPPAGAFGGIRPGSVRTEQLPVGEVARADIEIEGHRGAIVMLAHGTEVYELIVATAGSTKAAGDFERMLSTVAVR